MDFVLKYSSEPEKLPGLSRNGSQALNHGPLNHKSSEPHAVTIRQKSASTSKTNELSSEKHLGNDDAQTYSLHGNELNL